MRAARALLPLLLAALSWPAGAEEMDLDQILAEARETRQVENSIQKVRMVLVSRTGKERVREFEARVRRDGEVVKSWTRFSHPSDVAGTQLVLVDHPDAADEQLLYLPALKRVNRIAGRARSGSFMGSDFAFEDLEISGADDAKASLVSETDAHWVIDAVPGGDSSYGRVRFTVRKADKVPTTVEFFDATGAPLKRLTIEDTARAGDVVLPTRSTMEHLQKGTKTRLEVLEHRLNVPADEIPDATFTAAFMERSG
jgi:hypothetical protein